MSPRTRALHDAFKAAEAEDEAARQASLKRIGPAKREDGEEE